MRFVAYITGFLFLIGGLSWGAIEMGIPRLYVQIGAVILFGIGLIAAASGARSIRAPQDVTVVRDDTRL